MKLTQDDLLILLIEECGEVIHAATKCLRFGFDVDHGVDYGNNRVVLSREVGDLLAVLDALPLDQVNVSVIRERKIAKAEHAKAKYGRALSSAHQPIEGPARVEPVETGEHLPSSPSLPSTESKTP